MARGSRKPRNGRLSIDRSAGRVAASFASRFSRRRHRSLPRCRYTREQLLSSLSLYASPSLFVLPRGEEYPRVDVDFILYIILYIRVSYTHSNRSTEPPSCARHSDHLRGGRVFPSPPVFIAERQRRSLDASSVNDPLLLARESLNARETGPAKSRAYFPLDRARSNRREFSSVHLLPFDERRDRRSERKSRSRCARREEVPSRIRRKQKTTLTSADRDRRYARESPAERRTLGVRLAQRARQD